MGRPRTEFKFKELANGCVLCLSHASNKRHYPVVCRDGELTTVVRFLYEQKHGELPRSVLLRHTCDNTRCVNISHVITGTIQQNIADRDSRGRTAKGEKHGQAKLTWKDIKRIRRSKKSQRETAREYHISRSHLQRIIALKVRANS